MRAAVEAATRAEATAASVLETSKGISQQAFALARKILQVERWLPSAPALEDIDDLAGRAAAVDDVLDVAVVAWTARRIAAGAARSFPPSAAPGDAAIWA